MFQFFSQLVGSVFNFLGFISPRVLYFLGIFVPLVLAIMLVTVALVALPIGPIPLALLTILLIWLIIWYVFRAHPLPYQLIGISFTDNLPNIPWIPIYFAHATDRLLKQQEQRRQALEGLVEEVTFGSSEQGNVETFNAFELLRPDAREPDGQDVGPPRALEKPEQFSIGWTRFGNIDRMGLAPANNGGSDTLKDVWSAALTDPDVASDQFWEVLSRWAVPYNLLVMRKIPTDEDTDDIIARFFDVLEGSDGEQARIREGWTQIAAKMQSEGRLYEIDLTIFERFEAGTPPLRFTPGTRVLMYQSNDSNTQQAVLPMVVRISGFEGANAKVYRRSPRDPDNVIDVNGTSESFVDQSAAWIYALQAAKTSLTVYGIWIGHVYHMHIPTSTMQMTMFKSLPASHQIFQVLERHSDHLIGFDQFLLFNWNIGPPTSLNSANKFIRLLVDFSSGRSFFDDDFDETIERLGLDPADFTQDGPSIHFMATGEWNRYPIIWLYKQIWDACDAYAKAVLEILYPNAAADDIVGENDGELALWIINSQDPKTGNISGLPDFPLTFKQLNKLVRSLLYRVTVHGLGRIMTSVHPAATFVSNMPPCLTSTTIPDPDTPFVYHDDNAPDGTLNLSSFMPDTRSIGLYLAFAYTFIFTTPAEAIVPPGWRNQQATNLPDDFPHDDTNPMQPALNAFRAAIIKIHEDCTIEVYRSDHVTVDVATQTFIDATGRFPDYAVDDKIRVYNFSDDTETIYTVVSRTGSTLEVDAAPLPMPAGITDMAMLFGRIKTDTTTVHQWPLNIEI